MGYRIPKENYTEKELAKGKCPYTILSFAQLQRLCSDKLFSELKLSGKVIVTTDPPDAVKNILADERQAKQSGGYSPINEAMRKELEESKRELKRAAQEIVKREKEIERLKLQPNDVS
jgi:hypothetical protein